MSTVLAELFDRHFPNGTEALNLFRQHLAEAQLSFDVVANISVLTLPPQAGFPIGLPPFVHYFISGTQFGTAKKHPADPDDPAHAFTSDGVGLNMGCPIRLARALSVLYSLNVELQEEPLRLLKASKNHFAGVEELLWLTLWKQQTRVGRGGELAPTNGKDKGKNVDWFFLSGDTSIYLEAKFRPTDWMRNPDCGGRGIPDSFFDEIGGKFPATKSSQYVTLCGITGFAEPMAEVYEGNNRFFALCEKRLHSTPGLDGILYRSLLGQVYVLSLDEKIVNAIAPLINFPELYEYPAGYPVFFNRPLMEQRKEAKVPEPVQERGNICFSIVPTDSPSPSFRPEFPYRFQIPKRNKDGKPIYAHVPPFVSSLK